MTVSHKYIHKVNINDVTRLASESNETARHNSSDLGLNLTELDLNFTGLGDNSSAYAAKNVSNDHDFTKMFTPSAPPSSVPSLSPSLMPSQLPSLMPSSAPTFTMVESCPDFVVPEEPESTNDADVEGSAEVVSFFYEIITSADNTDVEGAVAAMETRILQDTASSFLSCNGRRRLQGNNGNIARVESDPPDVVDDVNECTTDTGIELADNMKCIPILGAMTFYNDCDNCRLPSKDILKSIRASMEDGVYADESMQASFAGSGDISLGTDPGVAVGSAIGGLAAVAFIAFAAVYKRRRSSSHLDLVDIEDDIAAEEEEEAKAKAFDLTNITQSVRLEEWKTVHEEDGAINVAPPMEFSSNWK